MSDKLVLVLGLGFLTLLLYFLLDFIFNPHMVCQAYYGNGGQWTFCRADGQKYFDLLATTLLSAPSVSLILAAILPPEKGL